jgi:hypothetical protein
MVRDVPRLTAPAPAERRQSPSAWAAVLVLPQPPPKEAAKAIDEPFGS